jgi:Flp pilus assembly protein TadD
VRLDPDDAQALRSVGTALGRAGDHAAALAACRDLLEMRPDSPRVLVTVAWILSQCPDESLHDPGEAVRLATRAVRLTPAESYPWGILGIAHYRAGDLDRAIDALERSMGLPGGNYVETGLYLAMSLFRMGKESLAREWLDRGVALIEQSFPEDEALRSLREEAEVLIEGKGR